jgi:hypothetical protein
MPKEENKSGEQKVAANWVTAMQKAGGPFVAAAERSRMPMVFSDPQIPGNPIIYANDSFLALTGYDREEVLGRSYHFMMGPGTDPPHRRRLRPRFTTATTLIRMSVTTARMAANFGPSSSSARFLMRTTPLCSISPRSWISLAESGTKNDTSSSWKSWTTA